MSELLLFLSALLEPGLPCLAVRPLLSCSAVSLVACYWFLGPPILVGNVLCVISVLLKFVEVCFMTWWLELSWFTFHGHLKRTCIVQLFVECSVSVNSVWSQLASLSSYVPLPVTCAVLPVCVDFPALALAYLVLSSLPLAASSCALQLCLVCTYLEFLFP